MNKASKRLFVKVDGIIETDLLREQCGFDEFIHRFIAAIEAQGWCIGGGFIPVNENGRRIKLGEAKD